MVCPTASADPDGIAAAILEEREAEKAAALKILEA